MFEQSILVESPTNKRWTVVLSLMLEFACVIVLIILPLIFTEQLAQFQWANTLIAPPMPQPAPVPLEARRAAVRTGMAPVFASKIFTVPAKIPARVAIITDSDPLPLVGTLGALHTTVGAIAELFTEAPPPPPPVVVTAKPREAAKPIRVSSNLQEAKLLRRVIPVYPALARQARVSGTVRLVGVIGKDGIIQNLQFVSGPPLLVQAALDAVKQWVYRPTLLNHEPVEVIAPIDVIFTLSQ
jgi:protein TonB